MFLISIYFIYIVYIGKMTHAPGCRWRTTGRWFEGAPWGRGSDGRVLVPVSIVKTSIQHELKLEAMIVIINHQLSTINVSISRPIKRHQLNTRTAQQGYVKRQSCRDPPPRFSRIITRRVGRPRMDLLTETLKDANKNALGITRVDSAAWFEAS